MNIIKAKNERIRELEEGPLAIKLAETKWRFKQAHTKLIQYRKQKTGPVSEYKCLKGKLTEKDCTIRDLEHDKLLLSEKSGGV